MKNPLSLNLGSHNRSIVGEVNWEQIEESISSNSFLFEREIVFFSHSEEVMNECSIEFNSSNITFKTYTDFNNALRRGIPVTADIVVLVDSFASASRANFAKLLQKRTTRNLQVIISDNYSVDELVGAIQERLEKLNQLETRGVVVENIIQSRIEPEPNEQKEQSGSARIMEEKDFRDLLNRELSGTENSPPETILAKAIEVINEIN
ncbi:MAG: hypothetical protein QNL65_03810 [Opitutales bacterium]